MKNGEMIYKYHTQWTYWNRLFWSVVPDITGIYCGVKEEELNDFQYMKRIGLKGEKIRT